MRVPAPAKVEKYDESLGTILKRAFKDPTFGFIFIGFFSCGYQLAFITAHFPAFITEMCAAISPTSIMQTIGVSTTSTLGAISIAIIGVFVISFQRGELGDQVWLGALLVLSSSFTYALHSAIVKKQGGDIEFTNFFLFRMLTSIFFLFLFSMGRGEMQWPTGWQVWLILFLAATINVVISRGLFYVALRRLDLSILTILLTLSPVITIMWSFILFGVMPSVQGLLGGTAVIAGVLLVTMNRHKKQAEQVK